jgi:hypothetical protein
MSHYTELDWEHTWPPLYGKPIIIPKNTILWRSYDTQFPAIGDRFAYYSSHSVASGYKGSSRELGCFVTSREVNLIDYRFMRVLLSRLIHLNTSEKAIEYLASIMLSFGLCSLGHQIELAKMRYVIPQMKGAIKAMEQYHKRGQLIEQTGVRIAETTNDIFTMGFLQELFKGIFDGFISPRLFSPFHVEKDKSMMSPEVILFNPKDSGIKEISYPHKSSISLLSINDLLVTSGHVILENIKKNKQNMNISMEFFMCGGGINRHYLDEADELLNNKEKGHVIIYNNGMKFGRNYKSKVSILNVEAPTPTFEVNKFRWNLET